MKLTETQRVLLSAAAQRDAGAVVLAPNLKGSATGKVVGIARAITGTAWSGPRFFGVRPYLSGSRDGDSEQGSAPVQVSEALRSRQQRNKRPLPEKVQP